MGDIENTPFLSLKFRNNSTHFEVEEKFFLLKLKYF